MLPSGISFFFVLFGRPNPGFANLTLTTWARPDALWGCYSCIVTGEQKCHDLTILELVSDNLTFFIQPQYSGLMGATTRVMHSIICCRVLLNLREAVKPDDTSVEVIASLVFVSPIGQQTNQLQTIA